MRLCLAVLGTVLFAAAAALAAEPEYTTIKMQIDVAKPAKDVWAKIGGYCDISKWLSAPGTAQAPAQPVDCKITSGDGGIGTVRVLAGGRVTEILVGKTDLSYGYTQPVREGAFYNLYHGFLEVKPVTDKTSRILYTLMLDESDKADKAAKDTDVANRKMRFEGALENMKKLAEGQ